MEMANTFSQRGEREIISAESSLEQDRNGERVREREREREGGEEMRDERTRNTELRHEVEGKVYQRG